MPPKKEEDNKPPKKKEDAPPPAKKTIPGHLPLSEDENKAKAGKKRSRKKKTTTNDESTEAGPSASLPHVRRPRLTRLGLQVLHNHPLLNQAMVQAHLLQSQSE